MTLFQPCDRDAIKSDKHQEHGTPITKLIPRGVRDALRIFTKDGERGSK